MASLAVALSGCDPGWNVHGTLVDAAGAPIGGATIAFRCGPRSAPTGPEHTMVSNAGGEFEASGMSHDPGVACSLEIVASGHPTKTVAITDACYRSTLAKNLGTT
ncbi:MAG TPA: carboxypeptidase-like regulatory domain-containing protein, partial [Polyangiaceae bacterium]